MSQTNKKKIEYDKKSPLQQYAFKWIKSRELFNEDSDYEGRLGEAVMGLIRTFSRQGHSGFSAELTRELFYKILKDFESDKIPIAINHKKLSKVK